MLLTVDFEKLNSLQDGDFLDPPKAAQILGLKYHAAYRLFKIGQIQSTVKPCNYNRSMGYFCTAAAIKDFLKTRKHRATNSDLPADFAFLEPAFHNLAKNPKSAHKNNIDKSEWAHYQRLKHRLECAVDRLDFLKNLPLSVPTAAKIIGESPFTTRQFFKELPFFNAPTRQSGCDNLRVKASDLKKFLQVRIARKEYVF